MSINYSFGTYRYYYNDSLGTNSELNKTEASLLYSMLATQQITLQYFSSYKRDAEQSRGGVIKISKGTENVVGGHYNYVQTPFYYHFI